MRGKRIVPAALAMFLGLTLVSPALAAEAADARLTRVTLAVKQTLDIGDEYTQFYGEPDETPLGARWNLNWTSDGEELNVTATEEGKVLSLYRWENGSSEPYYASVGGSGLSFPAMSRSQAGECAMAFLDKVLADNETATFTEEEAESLSATEYSFRGSVELNGLPSPMSVYVRIRLSDGAVVRFWRGDVSDYAGAPGEAKTSTTADQARALLKSTLDMRLEYVLDWNGDEEAPKKAVLRYLPNSTDEFYVDAATGELVNLTELQKKLRETYAAEGGDKLAANFATAAPEAADDAARSLTEVELQGVAKLEDVLDKEALDSKIRAWPQFALDQYTLGSASYSVDRDTGDVIARVAYAKNTADGIARRYLTLDAKTGELIDMSGYNPYRLKQEGVTYLSARDAQAKAEAFLKLLWGDQLAKTEVYDAPDPEANTTVWGFTFAQKVNGYFFPGNSISVRVDATDGSIMGFSKGFDDAVTFDDAQGLVSLDAAIDAWCASYPVELGYMEIPVALDMSEQFMPLRNAGYAYYNSLKPGYALGDRDVWYYGVDAKTGELVKSETVEPDRMSYDDLAGHWARAILDELARYQVGWMGGKAEPDKALTQLDYIALLASAEGYTYDPANDKDVDYLYSFAYRQGLLTKEEREDSKILTRAEAVKMLLDGQGYRTVAQLPGIFRCGFADAADIPEADLGYAALAQGLGIVSGDSQGNYAPQRTATRAEAAVMLWKLIKG